MMTDSQPTLSVVIPVYGCTPVLPDLHRRLVAVLDELVDVFEIIFVDDRGPQDPWPVLTQLAQQDPRVRSFRMSRNYGQQIAITAGLAECRGHYAIVMDCDLQDPPEVIPHLWEAARRGVDIVYAKRQTGEPRIRKFWNRLYFYLMENLAGYKADPEQGAFSLISRQVIDAYLQFGERERHYLFILRWLGFDSVDVIYARAERGHGRSGYTFSKLIKHALEGLFFQSTRLLLWILWSGVGVSLAGIVLAIALVWSALTGTPPEGWTSLMVIQLFMSGVILLALGGTGLYIARIFENSKQRPLYVLDRSVPERPSRWISKSSASDPAADRFIGHGTLDPLGHGSSRTNRHSG
jgi:dolichol-phosphate mannosyltransferase